MESQQQQPASGDTNSPVGIVASETAPVSKLPPAAQSDQQWQRIGKQFAAWLGQLPNLLAQSFNEFKQPIISAALIVAAIITLRVVLTILVALNGTPLLAPTFELIGVGYSVWFVSRYLLRAETRQELSQELKAFLDK